MSAPRDAGEAPQPLAEDQLITHTAVELVPLDLIVQWRRCSLAAGYLAATLAYHFADRALAEDVLSAGLNELIENLAKFSLDKRQLTRLEVSHYGDVLRVQTTNVAAVEQAMTLAERLDRMATEDPELLFLEQLEHTAAKEPGASGLGLISLKKDYKVRMGVALRPLDAGACEVSFTLDFDTDAIEQG